MLRLHGRLRLLVRGDNGLMPEPFGFNHTEDHPMARFPVHSIESTPEASRDTMRALHRRFGFVPNLIGELAAAPATLKAYAALSQILEETTFDPVEQQLILIATSLANDCRYCVAAHSAGLKMAGLAQDQIDALREGRALGDGKLEALRKITFAVVDRRGRPSAVEVRSFLESGYRQEQLLELLVGVAAKTISNYTNHLADTPLDRELEAFAWEPTAA